MPEIEQFVLHRNGWVPNNSRLPVLVYRSVVAERGDAAAERFEAMFAEHGWPADWRDGIYDYHHYHSTAHEALGVAAGSATLMLGGPDGTVIAVGAGDALVLPAGTGHCSLAASDDFLVVGAYPDGQEWDICREAPSDAARRRMSNLPVPRQDPVEGRQGRLVPLWR